MPVVTHDSEMIPTVSLLKSVKTHQEKTKVELPCVNGGGCEYFNLTWGGWTGNNHISECTRIFLVLVPCAPATFNQTQLGRNGASFILPMAAIFFLKNERVLFKNGNSYSDFGSEPICSPSHLEISVLTNAWGKCHAVSSVTLWLFALLRSGNNVPRRWMLQRY